MIKLEESNRIAKEHINSLSAPAQGYRLGHSEATYVEGGWYYDYDVLCELDIPKQEQEKFAGAFGFLISMKTGLVKDICHSEWVDLGLAFCKDPYGNSNAT